MRTADPPEPFSRSADRRSALDRAHVGDIHGAAGTLSAQDTGPRRSRRHRLLTLLAIAGPGLIVMAADNDAGSVSVFAQTGRAYGVGLLWVVLALAPVLYVGQEMAARLGAVTGAGHARLIRERYGRLWSAFSLGDLAVLNFALLVTELIGVRISLGILGVAPGVAVPLAALALCACTAGGRFARWERLMVGLALGEAAIVVLAVLHHPGLATIGAGIVPALHHRHGVSIPLVLLALVGTTICPWQIFLQQSSVIDKRITTRWLAYERLDIAVGTAVFVLCAISVIVLCATLGGPRQGFVLSSVGQIARLIRARAGDGAEIGFAVVLLSASLLGAVVVALSTSYATSEVLGFKHSLHRSAGDARRFHGLYALQVLGASVVVLLPHLPLGAVTTLVQALAGLLLPSALAMLLLLANDAELLGPRVNSWRLNAVAGIALAIIVGLSTVLTITTVLPGIGVRAAVAIAVGLELAAAGALARAGRRGGRVAAPRNRLTPWERLTPWDRLTWSAPGLERLRASPTTPARVLALALLRGYTIVMLGLLLAHLALLLAGR